VFAGARGNGQGETGVVWGLARTVLVFLGYAHFASIRRRVSRNKPFVSCKTLESFSSLFVPLPRSFLVTFHRSFVTSLVPSPKATSNTLVQANPNHSQHARLHPNRRPLGSGRCPERYHHQRRLKHQFCSRLDLVGRIMHCSMCHWRRELPSRVRQRPGTQRVSDPGDQRVLEELQPG
jgi:hypothetical protein